MEPGGNAKYLTFLTEGDKATEPPAHESTSVQTDDGNKRKVSRLPSLDLEAMQPAMRKKAKTNPNSSMTNDKTLTLVDLALEPAIIPSAEVKKRELENAVVTNGGYALTQLVSGASLKPVYSLAPEEYKENRWEGVYAKERRRFVLMAQQLHGEESEASDDEKAEGEVKWQEHIVRLLAAPITHRDQIDMVYLRGVSASNPTSLAWVIKIDLELTLIMKRDKSDYRSGKTAQKYVGPPGKFLWFGANAITAIRGMMGYSVPGVIHFGNEPCVRCRVDLKNASTFASLLVRRFEENTSYKALALPYSQTTGLEAGIGEDIVIGTGNCFKCICHDGCEKNARDQVIMSHRTLEELRDGIAYLEKIDDPNARHEVSNRRPDPCRLGIGQAIQQRKGQSAASPDRRQ